MCKIRITATREKEREEKERAVLDIYACVKWGAFLRESSKSRSAVEKMPHRGLRCCRHSLLYRYRDPSPFASSSNARTCA